MLYNDLLLWGIQQEDHSTTGWQTTGAENFLSIDDWWFLCRLDFSISFWNKSVQVVYWVCKGDSFCSLPSGVNNPPVGRVGSFGCLLCNSWDPLVSLGSCGFYELFLGTPRSLVELGFGWRLGIELVLTSVRGSISVKGLWSTGLDGKGMNVSGLIYL